MVQALDEITAQNSSAVSHLLSFLERAYHLEHLNKDNLSKKMKQGGLSMLQTMPKDFRSDEILQYIEEHYTEDLSLTGISALYGFSPNYFSSLFKKTATSTAVSYIVLLLLTAGTGAATYLFYRISYTRFVEMNNLTFYPSAGKSIYFLLVNPAVSFYYFMNGQTGSGREFYEFLARMGVYEKNFILENWVMIGIGIQFVLSVIFICVAVRTIDPMKKKYSVLL